MALAPAPNEHSAGPALLSDCRIVHGVPAHRRRRIVGFS
jgi:hypothetical protein